jgi:orotate phosphoribosyltransferase-like protein
MDLLQDEIKQYPTGLTRTQIAKSLDISKSKASVLVKKLLESDTGFEEVIEGRLRRIRFRGEE